MEVAAQDIAGWSEVVYGPRFAAVTGRNKA